MIAPNETRLTGHWLASQDGMIEDETCKRIASLTGGYLVKVGNDPSGWETLYRDPKDGRLWELTYPQSQLHGGGPPELHFLTLDDARRKYGDVAIANTQAC
jgi:hypothetical protein